jgi:hypothetical protein
MRCRDLGYTALDSVIDAGKNAVHLIFQEDALHAPAKETRPLSPTAATPGMNDLLPEHSISPYCL